MANNSGRPGTSRCPTTLIHSRSNNVFVNGIAVVNNTPDSAASDNALHPPTSTKTAAGSPNVFVGDG